MSLKIKREKENEHRIWLERADENHIMLKLDGKCLMSFYEAGEIYYLGKMLEQNWKKDMEELKK